MKDSYRILLFLIIAGVVIIGGPAIVVYATCRGHGATMFAEEMIMFVSLGAGVYACAIAGYCLLLAVKRLGLRAGSATLYYFPVAVFCLVLPSMLMYGSQAMWPGVFRGDSGFAFVGAPFMVAPLVGPVFLVFTIAFFTVRRGGTDERD
ncbi:MAG: hypothetical protein ABFC54_07355 [Thermoguttaceae bacterium]